MIGVFGNIIYGVTSSPPVRRTLTCCLSSLNMSAETFPQPSPESAQHCFCRLYSHLLLLPCNGVTGFQRIVLGILVKLYPVGYPAAFYPQTYIKMKKIAT
jgi:hypothetical protein